MARYGGPYTPQHGPHAGETYRSYFAYRTQTAKEEGYGSYREKRIERSVPTVTTPHGARQYAATATQEKPLGPRQGMHALLDQLAKLPPDRNAQLAIDGTWLLDSPRRGKPRDERGWRALVVDPASLRAWVNESNSWQELLNDRIFLGGMQVGEVYGWSLRPAARTEPT